MVIVVIKWKLAMIRSREFAGVFRILSNIYDGTFFRKWLTNISCPMIPTHTCANRGVRNVS